MAINRRLALKAAAAATGVSAIALLTRTSLGQAVLKEIHELQPGEFTWHPSRSPEGPVAIVVSITDQRVHVYRNGVRIAVSTCSTGKQGHATPTGVFTILEKDKNHHSSTYNNAPMPNMNRLTWSGVALHAGNLPGYPASHGCIRLPMKFSELLFGITHVGTPVIVAGSNADPADIVHPGLILSNDAETKLESVKANLKKERLPWQATVTPLDAPTAVVASSADATVTVLSAGEIVIQGAATIRDPEIPLGSHVFILVSEASGGLSWHGIGHSAEDQAAASEVSVLERVLADQSLQDAVHDRMHPGMVFITTDLPAHPDTRSGRDFVVMSQDIG